MDVLLKKYSYLVRKRANGLFLIGADKDDLLQEGMIGLFTAVISYNEEKDASFDTFASLCINRQMISAIRGANRYKHKLLNEYISIYSDENQQETQYTVSIPDNKFISVRKLGICFFIAFYIVVMQKYTFAQT